MPSRSMPNDDPERRFRSLPFALRRWSFSAIWRQVRMPVRRRRWQGLNRTVAAPYAKAAAPKAEGISLAMGDFSGQSGLSRAALYELERLRQSVPDLEAIDLNAPSPVETTVGTLYLLSAPDTFARLLPLIAPERIAEAHRIGLWVWESPLFPEDWRFALDLVHEIWTPSAYSRHALIQADERVPVHVRPHHVGPPQRVAPLDRQAWNIPEDAFLGLAIMDLTSCPARKNPWAHVAAWQAAFGDDPDKVLLLKARVSKRTRVVLDELAEMIGGAGNIHVFEAHLSEAEIAGLQRGADVYLSLHRAEGYGLNIRECLDAGIDVLATDWSANAEYGPSYDNYHPVPWRLVPYRDWTRHYPDGAFAWAEADIAAAARMLRALAARSAGASAPALPDRALS
ncbi:MAG: glycosyltransferase [Pseudomonadota bacterium]